MARLNPDGTLNDDWTDPFQGGDPFAGGGTDPTLDGSINSLSHIFPNDNAGGTSTYPAIPPGTKVTNGEPVAGSGLPTGTPPAGWTPQYVNGKDPTALTYVFDPTIGYYKGSDGNYYSKNPQTGSYSLVPGYSKGGSGYGQYNPNPTGTAGSGSQVNDTLSALLSKLFGSDAPDPNAALRSQLSSKFGSLMDQYSQPVSPTDPVIQANTDAYHGIEQRNLGQYGEMAAERAHAEGVPVGAFDSAVGNATSSAGRDEAANLGTRMTNETNARRAALGGVLGQASQFSSVTDAQKLQEELAVLSDATGNQQFYDSLSAGLGSQNNQLDSLIATLLAK